MKIDRQINEKEKDELEAVSCIFNEEFITMFAFLVLFSYI
jgi:hypothetical protein